jgi:hypothetical protein
MPSAAPIVSSRSKRRATAITAIRYSVQNSLSGPPVPRVHSEMSATSASRLAVLNRSPTAVSYGRATTVHSV